MGFELSDKKNIVALYKILEDDILATSQHIHLHPDNLNTFGLKLYTQLFLSANIFERCCTHLIGKKAKMPTWRKSPEITRYYAATITIIQMDYTFQPLIQFGEDDENNRVLPWWSSYNRVKHSLTKLDDATLENVLHAAASAGILVTKTCLHAPGGVEISKLFRGIHIPTFYE